MLASKLYSPTLREIPSDAVVVSHQYMLKAGMMRKVSNGLYAFLPLALRSIRKVEDIVREEMNAIGSQEILMPITQPAEIWKQSERWDVYGEEMFKLNDRHGHEYCLGPTHEELVTVLAKMDTSSYKQLPVSLYQIQNKYRDEKRPRFGLMRSREFIMKDAYTFDMDEEGLAAVDFISALSWRIPVLSAEAALMNLKSLPIRGKQISFTAKIVILRPI